MSSGYNELKLEILEEFENRDDITASDMANALRRTPNSISKAMGRYYRQGLLSRYTRNRNNEKVYSLTERGLERLDWLREQYSDDSDDNDDEPLSEIDEVIQLIKQDEAEEEEDINEVEEEIVE